MMPSQNLAAHLAHVRAEEAEIATRDIDEVDARLFALTMTDDGPDQRGQPSKLWTSRTAFQQGVHQTHNLPIHSSLPVGDILEGVSRLSLAQGAPLPEATPAAPVPTPNTRPSAQPLSHEDRRALKKEKCHRTTKAMKVINQIETKIGACRSKLTGTPTPDELREVGSALSLLHSAVEKVTRKTPSINSRKLQMTEQLAGLEALVAELKLKLPPSQEPVLYNSSE
jgi:hypothetical protein